MKGIPIFSDSLKRIFSIPINYKSRIFGLDIIRGFGIFSVMLGHGKNILPERFWWICDKLVLDVMTMFFVLSGFLIGRILIRSINENGCNFKSLLTFWIQRWMRTLPTYFFILILLTTLFLVFKSDFSLYSIHKYFYFSQNIFNKHPHEFFPEAWSLSIEEWFYFLIPLLIYLLIRLGLPMHYAIIITSVTVILFCTGFRCYRYFNVTVHSHYDWDSLFRKQVSTRLDSIMYGVLCAWFSIYNHELWIKYKKILGLIGLGIIFYCKYDLYNHISLFGFFSCVFSFSVSSIATAMLLPFLSTYNSKGGFYYKPITFLSIISYSIYLTHLSLIQTWILPHIPLKFFIQHETIYTITQFVLYWMISLGIATLLYKYFEHPITELRGHPVVKKITA